VVLAVLTAISTMACVEQGDANVSVNRIKAQLVFGAKEETTPPPLLTGSLAAVGDLGGLLPLEFDGEPFEMPDFSPRDLPAVGDCPKARVGSPIDPTTETTITGLPAEGVYKWRVDRIEKVVDGKDVLATEPAYVQRAVRRVKKAADGIITFETLEPGEGSTTIVSTFQVKETGTNQDIPLPVGVVSPPRVGEPERGVVLKKQVVLNKEGTELAGSRPFDPATGLLILPLQVATGETYQTAAVDRRSGDTYFADVQVGAREVIDACGRLTSGWAVRAAQSRTTSANPSVSDQYVFNYVVATQYGGLIIKQRTEFTPAGSTETQRWTASLIGLTPAPLPESMK
jgi:hypothetical protein